jgi:hypothetical protein
VLVERFVRQAARNAMQMTSDRSLLYKDCLKLRLSFLARPEQRGYYHLEMLKFPFNLKAILCYTRKNCLACVSSTINKGSSQGAKNLHFSSAGF